MAMVYDPANGASVYVNGQEVNRIATTKDIGRDNPWKLVFGNMDGLIDELRISRVARPITPTNRPPLVALTEGRVLEAPGSVQLRTPGVLDDEEELQYVWKVTTGNADSVRFNDPALPAPEVTFLGKGNFELTLEVTDGERTTSVTTDWVIGRNELPMIQGADEEVQLVDRSVADSWQADVSVVDDVWPGSVLTYQWAVVGGDANEVRLEDATTLTPTVRFLADGDYTLMLEVSDGTHTVSANFEFEVITNTAPMLNLGETTVTLQLPDTRTFQPSTTITDDGFPRDGAITIEWSLSEGDVSQVEISDRFAAEPVFSFLSAGDYTLEVEISDSVLISRGQIQVGVKAEVLTLLETWRRLHFTEAERSDPTLESSLWGPKADPDKDRLANLLEAYLGTNPRDADGHPLREMRLSPDGKALQLQWLRSAEDRGITVEVLLSGDLLNFEEPDPALVPTSEGQANDGRVRMQVDVALTEEPRYVALRAKLSDTLAQ